MNKTDVVIIGAGPVGLFSVFELGLLNLNCQIIDNLEKAGGQCSELYPDKPIFDIPSVPRITGQNLINNLMEQAKPFKPIFHLGQQAERIEKMNDNHWKITTSLENVIVARCIVIAGGAGSFVPRKPPIENIEKYEGKSVFYSIRDKTKFYRKKVIIAGGGVPQNMYKELLKEAPAIDAICFGEGEKPLLSLLKAKDKKKYIEESKSWISHNKTSNGYAFEWDNIENLDEIPFYDYNLSNTSDYSLNPAITALAGVGGHKNKDFYKYQTGSKKQLNCPN